MPAPIRILHLSDLHERGPREAEPWRRRRVLGPAWEKNLAALSEEGPIDLVCFTGDIADWGQPAEYAQATEIVESLRAALGLGRDRIFVVPGNHDIARKVEERAWKGLRAAIQRNPDLQGISRWLAGVAREPPAGMTAGWRPFEAGSAWLRALDELAGNRRILLCIDEFERLESLFPGDRADLLRLMGLLRGTIQHRRKLRLLVSGAAPFEELSGMWNDHFINVQEIRLDLLDEPTSIELLRRPIPEFPDDAIPEPVAREVFARTGGQPLLLQAFGFALVSRLNDQQSEPRRASLADVDAVQEQILQRYRPFFADTMIPEKIPPAARAALLALALGDNPTPELDARTRRWLRQRCLLTDDDRLRIPVLGAWIREEGLD